MTTRKPTTPYWIIGILALIWNLLGVADYLFQAFITDEISSIVMPIMIIIFCLFLIWYSKKAADDGILA